jgi:arginase
MPLRMIIDSGAVEPGDVALVGARDLDPPERDFIRSSGLHAGKHAVDRALNGPDCVYVALDFDALDEREVRSFMPVRGGISLVEAETLLSSVSRRSTVVGAGFSGHVPATANVEPAVRLCAAAGL